MKKNKLYKIHINNLRFQAIIGILEDERINEQEVIINFKAKYDKDIEFVDYSHIANLMEEMMVCNKYMLLEDAISDIINSIQKKYNSITKIKLKITKPNILKLCEVSISQ